MVYFVTSSNQSNLPILLINTNVSTYFPVTIFKKAIVKEFHCQNSAKELPTFIYYPVFMP